MCNSILCVYVCEWKSPPSFHAPVWSNSLSGLRDKDLAMDYYISLGQDTSNLPSHCHDEPITHGILKMNALETKTRLCVDGSKSGDVKMLPPASVKCCEILTSKAEPGLKKKKTKSSL